MNRFLKTLRYDWPRLIVELFVVVAGISISFALDEWRRDREDRREERRNWEAIRDNLGADSVYLASRLSQLQRMVSDGNNFRTTLPFIALSASFNSTRSPRVNCNTCSLGWSIVPTG